MYHSRNGMVDFRAEFRFCPLFEPGLSAYVSNPRVSLVLARKGIQPGNLSLCYTRGSEFSLRPESCNSLFSFKIMANERCVSRLCVPEGLFVHSGQHVLQQISAHPVRHQSG